ncbi:glycosyltransferase [Cohnella rhizosphaerae]|uniref:Glycosyltransferase n=1 Tax=Cohnella rhizosphaerae TaxID=1457232 RepID=A0A9X4KVC4_9BACL|nr:glycosyltransferase [Cohnella rhizosphaerae]MDG0811819.1 glycosyltransferase [Cohnella rhizosphaerae]
MDKSTIVSVVSIVYNQFDIVETFIEDVQRVLIENYENYEIILIDNGSTDLTVQQIKVIQNSVSNIRLIALSRHYDDEQARTAALDMSIGDYVILMDINNDPPSLIPLMLKEADKGNDLVIGERRHRKSEGIMERITSKAFYKASQMLTGYRINPNESDFLLLSRKVVNSIIQIRNRSRYLKYLKLEVGHKQTTIKYDCIQRQKKRKNRSFF